MSVKAPICVETERLRLRKPTSADADAIFERYAGDRMVARFLSWPRHRTADDSRTFLASSVLEWEAAPAGPYLIESRVDGRLLGSTGLSFETPRTASTGFVLARDVWGQGYATEALTAIVSIATGLPIRQLFALCHADHRASARVLEKCGFALDMHLPKHAVFPNHESPGPQDCLRYTHWFL